ARARERSRAPRPVAARASAALRDARPRGRRVRLRHRRRLDGERARRPARTRDAMTVARGRGQTRSHAPEPIRWDGETLELLDQTLLPTRVHYATIRDLADICDAIRTLKVRGAPAIGIAAAYGVVVSLAPLRTTLRERFLDAFEHTC